MIRDQRPLFPTTSLERVLDGTSVATWCELLNRRVFFFAGEDRLRRLLGAYTTTEHDVLVVDARALADRYETSIELTALNTGALAPAYAKRGSGTFVPIAAFAAGPTGAPAKPVAEITVLDRVLDVAELTLKVERWRGAVRVGVVWDRRG
ncbi:MAG: hypothetical protein QOK32_920 [Gaiellaceae bacterium]|nr:hypothetical protein [Gaiellaceae bacterium]